MILIIYHIIQCWLLNIAQITYIYTFFILCFFIFFYYIFKSLLKKFKYFKFIIVCNVSCLTMTELHTYVLFFIKYLLYLINKVKQYYAWRACEP